MKAKRTKKISLILVGAIAACIVAGCSSAPSRACVDANGVVMDPANCRSGIPSYFWYYGGAYGGGRAYGGSYQPSGGATYKDATPNVARGGLGTSASGGKASVSS